jgi:hypothetical protein
MLGKFGDFLVSIGIEMVGGALVFAFIDHHWKWQDQDSEARLYKRLDELTRKIEALEAGSPQPIAPKRSNLLLYGKKSSRHKKRRQPL